ncbi:lamin tail domain-containing protein [Streptomyces sp. NPDC001034]|uniref:lamin tail domain-containing protein n=1 Tax=Streptomyces sp. NPDC001034 TaxID=3154375 RepID=UPI003316565F
MTDESRRAVNLNGWTLSDAAGHTFTFRHYSLGARATVRVHTGAGRDPWSELFQDRRSQVWGNSDTARLRDDRGRLVDQVSWNRHRTTTHPRRTDGHRH